MSLGWSMGNWLSQLCGCLEEISVSIRPGRAEDFTFDQLKENNLVKRIELLKLLYVVRYLDTC